METIQNFFNYLFKASPGKDFNFYIPFVILIVLLFAGSIAISYVYKNRKKTDFAFKRLFKKTSNRLMLFGLLFLILILVRYENIPYFSMRIWLYLSGFLLLFYVYLNVKKFRIDYPNEKENASTKKVHIEENKYLPNKKKK